ncbi:unnamed protein product [Strongylus vulgaris]|uniref:Uncharacterized protein n=1 Tax=Strongylus vulgaris TaxID=40348 RepID=A0A3P7JWQ3_STRVU|nr:unnamed protein product [Strongylus vulgaris]
MQPVTVDAFQYRCYRVAVYDSLPRSAEHYSADYRSGGRPYDQFTAPVGRSHSAMSIDERRVKRFFRGEKRNAEKAVDAAKNGIRRTANDVKDAFRPPWYKRMWSGFCLPLPPSILPKIDLS